MSTRDLVIPVGGLDLTGLKQDWSWRIQPGHCPAFVAASGNCVFLAPDGSFWLLCMLEGDYRCVANSPDEYNSGIRLEANLNDWFLADWVTMAAERGLNPAPNECLGWKVHPMLGAPLAIDNLQIFTLGVYHSLMGQLFKQLDAV